MKNPAKKKVSPQKDDESKKPLDPASKAFGLVVRKMRQVAKISQEDLANIAEIERSHMGRIERGEKTPSLRMILKIASAFKVSSALLMTETEQELSKIRPKQHLASKAEKLIVKHVAKIKPVTPDKES